jgi:LacI family transcriptional regulator
MAQDQKAGQGPTSLPLRPHATLAAVAKRAGVSIATVSRVVNGAPVKIAAKTILDVRKAVADLDYRPQSAGRALRKGTTQIIAVLAANLGNPAMAAIASSIEHALRQSGYVMLLCDTHEQADIQDEYLREMEALRVRAVIMVVAVPSPKLDEFRQAGFPLVFVNRRDPVRSQCPYVGIDNVAAGRAVADHCLAQGYQHLAVIHASLDYSAGRERLQGFLDRMAEAGRPKSQIKHYGSVGLDHLEIGEQAMRALLGERARPPRPLPDVLVCLSDLLAYGAFREAKARGLSIPQDLPIISFDDGPLNQWIAQWLSAVRIPYELVGEAVIETLASMLAPPATQKAKAPTRDRIIPHQLIIRA